MIISDIFKVEYGQRIYHSKSFLDGAAGRTPLISSGKNDHGFYGTFDIEPVYKNIISVANTGSVGWAFYHNYSCCVDDNCLVLIPKNKISDQQMIYISMLINKDKYRYMYGRQVTPARIENIELPNIPNFVNKKEFPDVGKAKKSISDKKISFDVSKWKWFNLGDLFTFEKGERLTKLDRLEGDIPIITAGENNNGVSEYISLENFKDKKRIFENKITVDMFFNVFYHSYQYFSDDNIHTFIPSNFELNKYNSLFLVTVLNKLKYKYAYGRQVRLMRLPFERIKLPVNKSGSPDWQFMEDYIKSLPYSASI